MFVDSVICSDSSLSKEGEVVWKDVEDAVRSLDGERVTEVSIGKKGTEAHMSISGGAGCYLVSATLDNDVFWDAHNPDATGEPVKVVSGGQTVTVEQVEFISLDAALEIAKCFSESGKISHAHSWLKNPPD